VVELEDTPGAYTVLSLATMVNALALHADTEVTVNCCVAVPPAVLVHLRQMLISSASFVGLR